MSDVMSRPARVALHGACMGAVLWRFASCVRHNGSREAARRLWLSAKWHGAGLRRAIFCDWHLSPHAHRVIADMIGDFLLLAYGVIWFACAIIASVCIVLVLAALAGGF